MKSGFCKGAEEISGCEGRLNGSKNFVGKREREREREKFIFAMFVEPNSNNRAKNAFEINQSE